MENKQTAVEWLIKEIKNFDSGRSQYYNKAAIYDHAYRMEKEQMIDFIDNYINNCCYVTKIGDIGCNKTAEQYYNETYGK